MTRRLWRVGARRRGERRARRTRMSTGKEMTSAAPNHRKHDTYNALHVTKSSETIVITARQSTPACDARARAEVERAAHEHVQMRTTDQPAGARCVPSDAAQTARRRRQWSPALAACSVGPPPRSGGTSRHLRVRVREQVAHNSCVPWRCGAWVVRDIRPYQRWTPTCNVAPGVTL